MAIKRIIKPLTPIQQKIKGLQGLKASIIRPYSAAAKQSPANTPNGHMGLKLPVKGSARARNFMRAVASTKKRGIL